MAQKYSALGVLFYFVDIHAIRIGTGLKQSGGAGFSQEVPEALSYGYSCNRLMCTTDGDKWIMASISLF